MTAHSKFLLLTLLVFARLATATSIEISTPLVGAWFNEATPGQGLMVDVVDNDSVVFAAWFTFETVNQKVGVAEHRWLTLQGSVAGDEAQLDIFQTEGSTKIFNR